MKILITGAAGFIGSQMAYRLVKQGHQVVLVDNFSYGSEDNLIFNDEDFRAVVLKQDIRDEKAMQDIFKPGDIDYVYHFAGIAPLPDCQINPTQAIAVNVGGFVNILEAARKYGAKKIIFASTSAIYENDKEFPSLESKFELPSLIYANTKYTAERFAQSYCTTYGMNITCLRFANVYGPHIDCLRKQPPFVGYAIRELHYNRVPVFHSNGKQRRDYIYVDDLMELAQLVQQGDGFDIVNVASNENHSVSDLYHIMADIMGKNYEPEYMDEGHYWAKYPELYEGAYPISSEVLSHEVNKYTLCENSYAKIKYNWMPTVDIYEGLKRTIRFTVQALENADAKK